MDFFQKLGNLNQTRFAHLGAYKGGLFGQHIDETRLCTHDGLAAVDLVKSTRLETVTRLQKHRGLMISAANTYGRVRRFEFVAFTVETPDEPSDGAHRASEQA